MSKRAEEAALKAYPHTYTTVKRHAKRVQSELVDTHKPVRSIFQQGYEQAEKDNALTWEDIKRIDRILVNVRYEINNAGSYADIPWYFGDGVSEYKEALRRFNAERGKK